MKRVRISKHAKERWRERVQNNWSARKIADLVFKRLGPDLYKGIKPYTGDDGCVYYIFYLDKINDKFVFPVVTPDTRGLWSGWTVTTFMTDEDIESIDGYFKHLYAGGDEK